MSDLLYLALLGLVAAERLFEVGLSNRNRLWALSEGGYEVGKRHYPVMVVLHALFLPACGLEVVLLERPWRPELGLPMLGAVALTMALRYWAISSLGRRWNTRVVVIQCRPLETGGPYRWMRHPNYLAVVVEMAALPLVHGAWCTALAFSVANALLLRVRLQVEERALAQAASEVS